MRRRHQGKGSGMTYDEWRESYCSEPLFNEAMARAAWEAATAQEREACAEVCDAEFWNATKRDGDAAGVAAGNCAAEIRARGQV